eukprot:5652990-Amphidinium_carterae.1
MSPQEQLYEAKTARDSRAFTQCCCGWGILVTSEEGHDSVSLGLLTSDVDVTSKRQKHNNQSFNFKWFGAYLL